MFKVGERVKVIKRYVPTDQFLWKPEMDYYIGNEYLIEDHDDIRDTYRLMEWWFPPESLEKVDDPITHPSHYTYGKGLEVINVIDAFECGFEQGNIIKYILRYKHKGGLQDLEKAKWYLEHLIEKEKNNSELIK